MIDSDAARADGQVEAVAPVIHGNAAARRLAIPPPIGPPFLDACRVRRPEGRERDGAQLPDAARADGLAGEPHHRSGLVAVGGEAGAAVLAGREGPLPGLR